MQIKETIQDWGRQWLYVEYLYSRYADMYQLTFAALKALDKIYHEEVCTQKYLCMMLSMPKQTISSFMVNLSKQGLVMRAVSPTDHRQCEYTLTQAGRDLCEEIFDRLDHIEYEAFSQLSEAERESFTRVNRKLTKLIEQGMKGGD